MAKMKLNFSSLLKEYTFQSSYY